MTCAEAQHFEDPVNTLGYPYPRVFGTRSVFCAFVLGKENLPQPTHAIVPQLADEFLQPIYGADVCVVGWVEDKAGVLHLEVGCLFVHLLADISQLIEMMRASLCVQTNVQDICSGIDAFAALIFIFFPAFRPCYLQDIW